MRDMSQDTPEVLEMPFWGPHQAGNTGRQRYLGFRPKIRLVSFVPLA